MSTADARAKLVAAAFQMPSVQTMVSRKSSITNAFVNSLIPVITPTNAEIEEALAILEMDPDDLRCAYCGDRSTEWDHLRPLVLNLRPTGYISEIGNLVPSCGKCNQSKGNKNWLDWMQGGARWCPMNRKVPDLDRRINRLKAYEAWKNIRPIDFESIVDKRLWSEYWDNYLRLVEALKSSQVVANKLREQIAKAHESVLPKSS